MRVLSVVGARPQFVKLAPVAAAMAGAGVAHTIVHTGQHYDPEMSDVFFRDLGIPDADIHLGVGSGSHGVQTAKMLVGVEAAMVDAKPDCVLVYGDTNSTLAAALAAVKLGIPLAHLEAGLRSWNREMPEEHNRVLTDHAADLCLAPTENAIRNLGREGLAGRSVLVGDVMADVCLSVRDRLEEHPLDLDVLPTQPFVLATVHRPSNTDDPARLAAIVDGLARLSVPVVLPVHPRLRAQTEKFDVALDQGSLRPCAPLSYLELIWTILRSQAVVTDSGGIQKEAFLLRRPCTTIRSETEWVETLEDKWNVLDPDCTFAEQVVLRTGLEGRDAMAFGRGDAARRTVEALEELGHRAPAGSARPVNP